MRRLLVVTKAENLITKCKERNFRRVQFNNILTQKEKKIVFLLMTGAEYSEDFPSLNFMFRLRRPLRERFEIKWFLISLFYWEKDLPLFV